MLVYSLLSSSTVNILLICFISSSLNNVSTYLFFLFFFWTMWKQVAGIVTCHLEYLSMRFQRIGTFSFSTSLHSRHLIFTVVIWASLMAQMVKSQPALQETQVQSLGQEDFLEKEMTTHSSILAWEIPWTEEPDGLQPTWSQRVRHDWATKHSTS